jgi:hypothetical protein
MHVNSSSPATEASCAAVHGFKRLRVKEVPENIAACELDSRKEQCRNDEWASSKRQASKAGGEMVPANRVALPERQT